MKKIALLSLTVLVLLGGCFFDGAENEGAKNAETSKAEAVKDVEISVDSKQQATIKPITTDPAIPSQDDGSLYIQALASHKVEDCKKISNKELQTKCTEVVVGK